MKYNLGIGDWAQSPIPNPHLIKALFINIEIQKLLII